VGPQERAYGFHAGEIETAFLLHGTPELVDRNKFTTNYIARIDDPGVLKPEGSAANFSWLTMDIAPSGVLGDPAPATAENGERWVNEAAARVAEALLAMYHFEPRHGA
jgi:creatinine amidohydrolase